MTWYGPGFYGNRTACGVRYTRTIVGVAHRTLPCGTLVRFQWHGITAVAPVIDRGPYASAAYVFDFSAALSCEVFKPKGIQNACFTRHDVQVAGGRPGQPQAVPRRSLATERADALAASGIARRSRTRSIVVRPLDHNRTRPDRTAPAPGGWSGRRMTMAPLPGTDAGA